jgi:hypothetical protein
MKDLNGNEYFTTEKVNEIINEKFKTLDSFTRENKTEIIKIEHEYTKGLNYVYLECTNPDWSMKRYYKIVFSYGFTFIEYKSSNVLDKNESLNIQSIKEEFKNKLIYLLSKTI